MRATQEPSVWAHMDSCSLILPIVPGTALSVDTVAAYREILEEAGAQSVEVIIADARDGAILDDAAKDTRSGDEFGDLVTRVSAEASDWPTLVRAGLAAATGERLVVVDVNRHYPPEALARVIDAVRNDQFDLAIAVPLRGRANWGSWVRSRLSLALFSRMMLGTSDVFSGLFALRGAVWDSSVKHGPARGSSLVLDSLLRHQARCIDVPVPVDRRFRAGRLGLKDVRPIKRILDGRFGNYSRLVQFCIVGASGMVIDLSCYALLQLLLSFTWLADRRSALFGSPWHLAVAAGMAIAIALVWNFTLNRRLTFNDAHKGALLRQFSTYVLSNGLAIIMSFSVRLFLPAHFGFFARHRLAAAVVGIVAATGISFSMARWLVFARRPS